MEATSTISHKAEIFQSKLIENFQLLETFSEQGRKRAPVYNSTDILEPSLLEKLLSNIPEQTIKFKVYKRDHIPSGIKTDRRLNRVTNQNKLPLGVWATWITESNLFQIFIFILIIINSTTISIQGEMPLSDERIGILVLKQLLQFIDLFCITMFYIEIWLKCASSSFKNFYKDSWNIFDLVITTLSALPSIISLFSQSRISQQLAGFRIIRALKIIYKFSNLQIIVLTILQASKSLIFIFILLIAIAYIFAVFGTVIFEPYSMSQLTDLNYSRSFRTLPNTMVTLFQLFTFEAWFNLYNEIAMVSNKVLTGLYILLWIWIGAFVFRNLFVGIMVNNFKTLSVAVKEEQSHRERLNELMRLKEELVKQVKLEEENNYRDKRTNNYRASDGWGRTVHSHLLALASKPKEMLWPRDTLFKYLQLMGQLQENLEEYDQLQKLARDCLLSFHGRETQIIENEVSQAHLDDSSLYTHTEDNNSHSALEEPVSTFTSQQSVLTQGKTTSKESQIYKQAHFVEHVKTEGKITHTRKEEMSQKQTLAGDSRMLQVRSFQIPIINIEDTDLEEDSDNNQVEGPAHFEDTEETQIKFD